MCLAIQYNFSIGSPELRQTAADLFNRHFKPSHTVHRENIVCTNGITGLVNSLVYTLLDENEALIMPLPAYNLLVTAAGKRNHIHCLFSDVEDIDQFSESSTDQVIAAFAATIAQAEQQGTPAKAILLCNPHNPLGKSYDREVLKSVLKFCQQQNIHLIVDEIYALSAFPGSFCSALSIEGISLQNLHVMYGVSKVRLHRLRSYAYLT